GHVQRPTVYTANQARGGTSTPPHSCSNIRSSRKCHLPKVRGKSTRWWCQPGKRQPWGHKKHPRRRTNNQRQDLQRLRQLPGACTALGTHLRNSYLGAS